MAQNKKTASGAVRREREEKCARPAHAYQTHERQRRRDDASTICVTLLRIRLYVDENFP
jgi:hypothetical protein